VQSSILGQSVTDSTSLSGDAPLASPEPLQGHELSISLTVKDLERSTAWYRDVLGVTIDRKFEREGKLFAVSLRAGAARLLLGQDNGARGLDRTKGEGFSMQITTAQDIDAIANRVKASGTVLETEPSDAWGARVFRVRDPDGFLIVISSIRQ
jgi:glyoxylase I family protein